ncbi:MAG: biopolymer transporter ExbD [Lentisphaerae bacterium]|jgi:biopolymer transport protein ExbD|nr:biopolymer transporter ExbD [Lentisphaerota bacterium]
MNLSGAYEDAKMELQISPLIDVVFLLLIYFIVSAKILQPEGDIPFQLPAQTENDSPPDVLPIEARLRINEDDSVVINNGMSFDPSDKDLGGLVDQLLSLQVAAESQRVPFFVTLNPTLKTRHTRIVDVMDACAEAKVTNLTFSKPDE